MSKRKKPIKEEKINENNINNKQPSVDHIEQTQDEKTTNLSADERQETGQNEDAQALINESADLNNQTTTNKITRPKGKKITFVMAIFTSFIVACGVIILLAGSFFAYSLLKDSPKLNVEDLPGENSSIIYDAQGDKIMELGTFLRKNVEYQQLPNCVVDAFLAIEDSRFFEHPGFDVPRFSKAILVNLKNHDFSQGGSTISMQLIKNTYFTIEDEENSTIAERHGLLGVKRKLQEIFLALRLDGGKQLSKQEIINTYINKINYGNNIRGIEKASEYYFNKDVSELNVGEAALMAGLINSPNSYNPYNNIEKFDNGYLDEDIDYLSNAQQRKDEVLDLMLYHGYISQIECDLYKNVKVEDMISGINDNFKNINDKYQSYIDAVVDEVIDQTGLNPYDVGMEIHTNMNPYMQEYIYDMQNEADYIGIKFPNDLCQSALVLLNNQTGAIEALGGGRGESTSARAFNRATSAYLNPGSSIKPVLDYALAIEKLGYATSHTFTDMPYYLYGGDILVTNYDNQYHGDMLMSEALGRSQNTPAVQALAAVVDKYGENFVIDYLNSIGFNFTYDDFDLQFAIGGSTCTVTPLQLAAAHGMFINGGRYIKPHTIDYIDYFNKDKPRYIADTLGVERLSKETAYMMSYLEYYNMYGSYSSLMWYCKKDYPLYGKTGTTDWGNSGKAYGIPFGATKDSWLVMQTNKYTISCWTGYDQLEEGSYFSNSEYQQNTKSKLVDKILDQLIDHHLGDYDPYQELERPEGVVDITHIKGAYPYAYPSGGYPTVKGMISQKALDENPLVSYSEALEYARNNRKVIDASYFSITSSYDGNLINLAINTASPASSGLCSGMCDLSTTNYNGDTTNAVGKIDFPHWNTVYRGEPATGPFTITVYNKNEDVIFENASGSLFTSIPIGQIDRGKVCVTDISGSMACEMIYQP